MVEIENLSLEQKFENFWLKYPKKVWKKNTYKKFIKIKDFKNLFLWLEEYLKLWEIEWTPRQYIPNPETFLNQERYYDEIIIDTSKKSKYEAIQKKQNEIKEAEKNKKDQEDFEQILKNFYDNLEEIKKEEIKYLSKQEILIRFPKIPENSNWFRVMLQTNIKIKIKNLYINRLELCTQ